VFIKGGARLSGQRTAIDVFYDGAAFEIIEGALINTAWTHGAGCTSSAAIAAGLARGLSPIEAVRLAKAFITASLSASFALNRWVGPGNPSAWRTTPEGASGVLREALSGPAGAH
jgi:pyridoxine kinase